MIPGTETSWIFTVPMPNIQYEFAIQPANAGGPGPISFYQIGFFCKGKIVTIYTILNDVLFQFLALRVSFLHLTALL